MDCVSTWYELRGWQSVKYQVYIPFSHFPQHPMSVELYMIHPHTFFSALCFYGDNSVVSCGHGYRFMPMRSINHLKVDACGSKSRMITVRVTRKVSRVTAETKWCVSRATLTAACRGSALLPPAVTACRSVSPWASPLTMAAIRPCLVLYWFGTQLSVCAVSDRTNSVLAR